jgi:cytochrome P450
MAKIFGSRSRTARRRNAEREFPQGFQTRGRGNIILGKKGPTLHFCLGHQLARIEAKSALEALFKRWPGIELAVPPNSIHWRARPGLRAIELLPVPARTPL